MHLDIEQEQRQEQTLSPKMIQFYAMLQLPALELEQLITQELEQNPALELMEERVCPSCGAELEMPVCPECAYRSSPLRLSGPELGWVEEEINEPSVAASDEAEEWEDPFARLEAPVSLRDHLQWHFLASTNPEEFRIGRRLIDEINSDGYFTGEAVEAALDLNVPVDEIERVLHLIQQLDPIGVGARNLQECLLIQLDYLAEQGKGHALARELVEKCWAEVGRNKYADAARLLGVRSRAVQEAMDFVREHLNPYPGREFRLPWQSTAPDQVPTVRPDVIVRETGNPDRPYEVEVVSSPSLSLRVNRLYQSLWRQMQQTKWHSQQERQHVREYVARARQFIDNINQRRETLKCITECIVQEQYAFLDRGVLHLKPLTRVQIAERMGVHESTVGRAIVDKYVMLPSEEIVPFDLFFDTALPARRIIHHLVQHEDPYKPLSDDELVELLAERGFHLARRTVAKYRAELKILPYFQRKRY